MLVVEGVRAVLIGAQLWLSYDCFHRSCRQTTAVKIWNARLANGDRSWNCVTDPGRAAGMTGGDHPFESWL